MNKKLVITGMGAVTPIGIGVNEYWDNLMAGKTGIDYITTIDASDLP
ncbi:MAG: beta-ketoacyl-[acyl-carrier-protein] synthase II, partial [Clostridiales bacterium]|nr:beta-ketoacyl-[acyl-carrier-protein] synthase II [Clostridiales bacterium]